VPVFLGQGGHVRRDLAGLIAAAQARFAGTSISCVAPAGEDEGVLDALARYCVSLASQG
jgi:sirohydrochlorin cobaltochelatase